MAMSTQYKPSPLSYGSPRSSPFRRPESPATSSPLRQSTPNPSPSKMPPTTTTTATVAGTKTTPTTPSRFNNISSPTSTTETDSWTPRGLATVQRERDASPTRSSKSPATTRMFPARNDGAADSNALGKLQPAQVRELREGFQILDRDSDGQVGREDVADMLAQLGMPANSSDITAFFPPSTPQTVSLPTFLNSIAASLAALSAPSELLSAFAAFDEDDSGQVDLAELRDSLLHTAPEVGEKPLTEREIDRVMNGFTGRRAFGKYGGGHGGGMGKRGEVFKYQEFVASVQGGTDANGKAQKGDEE